MAFLIKPLRQTLLSTLLIMITLGLALAEENTQDEIAALKRKIATSQCEFERNGTRHSAVEALAHINKKHDYYEDDIVKTEDFIRLTASQSLISKKPYYIHCPGKKGVKSKEWLQAQLADYRDLLN